MKNKALPRATSGRPDSDVRKQIPARVGQAAMAILRPLARLFVAHGVEFRDGEQLLKQAFLDAGRHELRRAGIKPNISRISVSTGLHRRDVKKLSDQSEAPDTDGSIELNSHSVASELYMRWSTDAVLSVREEPLPLRASNGEPSFDELARSVSTDAHPRSLLEELKRLELVSVDEEKELVSLQPGGFVPLLNQTELLELLGQNVAAHIDTAVGNVLEDGKKFLEQAICEQQLSADSVEQINRLSRDIWNRASRRLVPALVEAKRTQTNDGMNRTRGHDVRIGMYMYTSQPRTPGSAAAAEKNQTSSMAGWKRSK